MAAEFGEQYRLVRELGAGGMGTVWLAIDQALDRKVAIKAVHPHLMDGGHAARFQQEMRLAAQMQHPGIMMVYTVGTHDGSPFMVMEYLDGHDLETAAAAGRLDADDAAGIGRQVCDALAYAHGQGVVHRDIKPANLVRCSNGQVKITDFGIAKAMDGTGLTATGGLIGTPAYMSPQQWLGEPAAPHDDIWALGCALYRLTSGRLPYTFTSPREYLAAAARQQASPDLRTIAAVPEWFAQAVTAMLNPDAASRPTAAECADLLTPGHTRRTAAPKEATPPAAFGMTPEELTKIKTDEPSSNAGSGNKNEWRWIIGAAIGVCLSVAGVFGMHNWASKSTPIRTPTPSPTGPSCAARYCGKTHFDRSASRVDSKCSDTQCQMSATFKNDGSMAGSATVTFTVTAIDYGPLIGSCSTVIPQTAPNGSTSAGCTAYFSSHPGTVWLNTTIDNP